MSTRLSITVDLQAIANNWLTLKAALGLADCAAVVKADAYGLGAKAVVAQLLSVGCRHFFVANINEAAVVRGVCEEHGIDATIYTLQGCEPHQQATFIQHRIIPVLISAAMARQWLAYSQEHLSGCLPCAIKINTGMNRLGLDPCELKALVAEHPALLHQTEAPLLVSHLACADEPDHPLNALQLATYREIYDWARALNPAVRGSLANSSGIFLGAQYHFELARPGAALYGLNPQPYASNPMQSVLTLRLPIVQLRKAPAGSFVGYGAQTQLQRDSHLATVAGGYADGFFRTAVGRMRGWVGGVYVPLMGRVSMDALVFDVTDAGAINESDSIEILGAHMTADEQGFAANTIGYEVLTRLGDRIKRHYIGRIGRRAEGL
ncbi:MAG: alanine racemase [Marinagarivorans sp.]|nr:alanine racemase [Marinagarivorans sp.]